jgi:hypothetical protein
MDTQLFILPQRGRHCWTCATSQAADRLFTTNEVLYVKSHLPSPVQDIEKKYKYSFNTLTNARKARIFTRSGCFGLNELQLAGVKRLFPSAAPSTSPAHRRGGGERASSPLAVPQVAASTRFPSLLGTRARIYSTPVALARPPTKRNAVPVPHLHVGPPLVLPNPSRQCSTRHIYPG